MFDTKSQDKDDLQQRIKDLEEKMSQPDFWQIKEKAQVIIREISSLKEELLGFSKYDKRSAIITIFSGAGGDDAEDFSAMLFNMYLKFIENNGWKIFILHQHKNDHGGYRNLTFEVEGKTVYGILKNESGVHRLVRLSPFNAKKQRHTSFSMVEVVPKLEHNDEQDLVISEDDLRIEFSRSSGPGGQNVNKRETAVRIVHIPTNIAVHVESERTQEKNRDKALTLLRAKLYRKNEEDQKRQKESMYISKTTEIEWGNQIRSYVLHPYKMIKDHRTKVEVKDVESVLEDGKLEEFIKAERDL